MNKNKLIIMTPNQKKITNLLNQIYPAWTSPTNIAKKLFPNTNRHSSWASPICLKLVKKGYLLRNNEGWYRIKIQGNNT